MVVTAHQPNYLPGASVVSKILATDAVLWLDEVLYGPHGWTNRNRMPDGSWLTVPLEHPLVDRPINRVRVSEHGGWRRRHARTLSQHYGAAAGPVLEELARPYRLLVGLNLAVLRRLLPADGPAWHFQSHLDGGRPIVAVTEEAAELRVASVRLALMVEEVGGTAYLSGPSGRNYLDERPFHDRGIEVLYHRHDGPNPCLLEALAGAA